MRILVVQESDWIKRNPVQQHHMMERLSVQGHEVLVIDYPIRWQDEGRGPIARRKVYRGVAKIVPGANVTVIRTASLRVPGLGKLAWLATNTVELARAFRSFKPDVVVTLGLTNSLIALWMARAAGVPVVVHLIDALHTLAEPEVLRPIAARVESAILRRADRVVVINKALGTYAERMGADSDRVEVIPTGTDLERFGPHVDGSAVREEFGLSPNDTVMLFVGWLYTFSGLKELAEAMAAEEDPDPSLKLMVVGDGDLMPELKRLRDERLGGRLVLTGAQPSQRMPEFMAAADVCLLPAHTNATMEHIVPTKVYEYLAAGKPILASRLQGLLTEFEMNSGLKYIADPYDLLQVAKRLMLHPSERQSLGSAAVQKAESSGTWDEVTEQMRLVLANVRPAPTEARIWGRRFRARSYLRRRGTSHPCSGGS